MCTSVSGDLLGLLHGCCTRWSSVTEVGRQGFLPHPSRGTLPATWVMRMLAALACLPPSLTVGVAAAPETAFG